MFLKNTKEKTLSSEFQDKKDSINIPGCYATC